MTLPPIPAEAAAAAVNRAGTQRKLEAAWPHLYAAALRHAADELADDDLSGISDFTPDFYGGVEVAVGRFRHMADEAVQA